MPTRYWRLVALTLAAAVMACGQTQVVIRPDCQAAFTMTAAGQTSVTINNVQAGCYHWQVTYNSQGFTVLSLAFESAPNVSGAPGTWVTFAGATIVTGVNPNTATTQASTELTGYNPFARMRLVSVTGTGIVSGFVYGCRQPGCATSQSSAAMTTCPGTVGTPCVVVGTAAPGSPPAGAPVEIGGTDGANVRTISTDSAGRVNVNAGTNSSVNVAQVGGTNTVTGGVAGSLGTGGLAPNGATVAGNPNLQGISDGANARTQLAASAVADANAGTNIPSEAPSLFNGATWDRQLTCPSSVIVDDSSMGNSQIIAASGATRVHICKMTLTAAASVSIQLTQGTGANCGTGTANLSGLYQATLTIAEDFIADQSGLTSAASQAVCLNLSAGTRTTGTVFYVQF